MIGEEGTKRTGRQCRERWISALNPTINKGRWNLQEDYNVLHYWLQKGNKWRDISSLMSGRNEIQVKNRFNCLVQRNNDQVVQAMTPTDL